MSLKTYHQLCSIDFQKFPLVHQLQASVTQKIEQMNYQFRSSYTLEEFQGQLPSIVPNQFEAIVYMQNSTCNNNLFDIFLSSSRIIHCQQLDPEMVAWVLSFKFDKVKIYREIQTLQISFVINPPSICQTIDINSLNPISLKKLHFQDFSSLQNIPIFYSITSLIPLSINQLKIVQNNIKQDIFIDENQQNMFEIAKIREKTIIINRLIHLNSHNYLLVKRAQKLSCCHKYGLYQYISSCEIIKHFTYNKTDNYTRSLLLLCIEITTLNNSLATIINLFTRKIQKGFQIKAFQINENGIGSTNARKIACVIFNSLVQQEIIIPIFSNMVFGWKLKKNEVQSSWITILFNPVMEIHSYKLLTQMYLKVGIKLSTETTKLNYQLSQTDIQMPEEIDQLFYQFWIEKEVQFLNLVNQ